MATRAGRGTRAALLAIMRVASAVLVLSVLLSAAPSDAGRGHFRRSNPTVRTNGLRRHTPHRVPRPGIRLLVLQRRTDRSITSVKRAIDRLGVVITGLEAENADKERQASSLVTAIRERQSALRQRRNAKGFFGAIGLLGSIATGGAAAPLFFGGLVLAARDGVRVSDLEGRLAALKSERASIDGKIQSHRSLKRALQSDLEALQATEATVRGALREIGTGGGIETARTRLEKSRDLLDAMRGQVTILERIERSAAAVGVALDLHIGSARQHLSHAESLVAASTRDYVDLVAIALSRNPAAVAGNLLDGLLVDRATALLREAGLGARAAPLLARSLVRRVRAGAATEARLTSVLESRLADP
jgi:hypothetical protein